MARLPVATRLLMRLDVWAVRWTGGSFFMWLFARRAGLMKNPEIGSRKAEALVLVTRAAGPGARAPSYFPTLRSTIRLSS
jgi:hypothetical protein